MFRLTEEACSCFKDLVASTQFKVNLSELIISLLYKSFDQDAPLERQHSEFKTEVLTAQLVPQSLRNDSFTTDLQSDQ